MKRLSIIIVTYQSESHIYDCLSSVWSFCDIPRKELEVIVVDNSPKCELMFKQLRKLYGDEIMLIHNTHNGGYGQGNNVGIRQATAPVVMIMNPDVRLYEPLFNTAVNAFEKNDKLCMYGMKQMFSEKIKSPLSFDCTRRINGYVIPFLTAVSNKFDFYCPKLMYLQGACFFINKEKFIKAGLFDEDIFMYGEEDDIHWRITKMFGPAFYYNKNLHYLHLVQERPMSLSTERKMVESIVVSNEKKGKSSEDTYKNFIRYYRIRYISAYIKKLFGRKKEQKNMAILKTFINELKQKVLCLPILFLMMFCHPVIAQVTTDDMPIIAYWGVPDTYSNEENFRIFSECGFTVSLFPYASLDNLVKACRLADKFGVKILGSCPEMENAPQKAASTLKKEKGFYGYFIQDEPSVPEMRQKQKEIESLQKIDNTHIFYINLFPYSKPEWVESNTKVKTYPEYLKAASATPCQQISFDFYPITTNGLHETWYQNLEMVRSESLSSHKPFWGFALSVPHNVPFSKGNYYPTPTIASLRLQIYSNLVYGAQAIQYFTYWTPDSKEFNFHDAPINQEGKKTKTYSIVQKMNKELKTVAKLFYGARVLSVNHIGVIAKGTKKQNTAPTNIKSLKTIGRKGAIISQFEKNAHHYLSIVNKDYDKDLDVHVKAKNNIPCHVTKSLTEEPLKASYTVAPGDILLLKLN